MDRYNSDDTRFGLGLGYKRASRPFQCTGMPHKAAACPRALALPGAAHNVINVVLFMRELRLRRRLFIASCAAGLPLAGAARSASASLPVAVSRSLQFTHLHTGERLTVEYMQGGAYVPDALAAVNHLLRDFRCNDVGSMDPALLDLLHGLAGATGSRQPFQIISGYRSPATNAMLHARSSGVASGSLHMRGQALDIRLGDVPLASLRDAAKVQGVGGVGFYPGSDFVHVDTGRIRYW